MGALIGGIVGGVLGCLLLTAAIAAAIVFLRRRQARDEPTQLNELPTATQRSSEYGAVSVGAPYSAAGAYEKLSPGQIDYDAVDSPLEA